MAKLNQKEIRELALRLISESQGGIRYAELQRKIQESSPETPKNTICGSTWDIDRQYPNKVIKPSRGLFMTASSSEGTPAVPTNSSATDSKKSPKIKEEDFYSSFAEYLKSELDEAVVAASLGGAGLRAKWGTPDVVGVYKPRPSDRIKFDPEVIAAEIKTDPGESITAFGQATAYRLFASKVYVVMPKNLPSDDLGRLESLALLFGVGLVLFDPSNPESPDYEIRVRAQRFAPDLFYLNKFADDMHRHAPNLYNELF